MSWMVTGSLIYRALFAATILPLSLDRATVLAVSVSLDKPEDDPERRNAIINEAGRQIGAVPVYSKPTYDHQPDDAVHGYVGS